jgi:hypothetical protein
MTLRDRSLAPLSLRHLNVLDALRADAARPDGAEGLTPGEVTSIGATSWPEGLVAALVRHGYLISLDHGRYFLEQEPVSTGAEASGGPADSHEVGLPEPVGDQAGVSVPVETGPTRLFEVPAEPSHQYDYIAA